MGGDVAVAGAAAVGALKKHVGAGVKRKAAAGAVAPSPARLQKVVVSGGKASGAAASSSPLATSTDSEGEEDYPAAKVQKDAEKEVEEEQSAAESPSNSAGGEEGKNSARRRNSKCHYCQSMSAGVDCGLVAGKCPNRPCDSCGGRHRLGRCRKYSPSGSSVDSQNSLEGDDGAVVSGPSSSSSPVSAKPSEAKKGVKPQLQHSPSEASGKEWGYPQQQGQPQQVLQPGQQQQQQQHPGQGPDTSRSAGSAGSGKSSGMRRASKPNLTLETSASALESAYPGFDPVLSPTLATITPRNMQMMVGDSPLPSPTAAHDLINSLASPFGGAIANNNLFASLGGLNLMHPFFPNTPMAACMTPMNGLGLQGKLGEDAEAAANAQAINFFNSMGGAGDMSSIFLGGMGMSGIGMGGAGGFFNGSGLTTTISPRKVAMGAHDDGMGLGHGYGPAKKQQMQLMQQVVQPPPRNQRFKGLSINTAVAERDAAGVRSANNTGTHASVATHSSVDSGEVDSPTGKGARQYTMLRKRSACHYCSEIGSNCGLVAGKCPNRPCKTCQGRHRHGRCRMKKSVGPVAAVVPALAPAQPAK